MATLETTKKRIEKMRKYIGLLAEDVSPHNGVSDNDFIIVMALKNLSDAICRDPERFPTREWLLNRAKQNIEQGSFSK